MARACGGSHSILHRPLGSYSSHVCASSFRICSLAGACALQVCCSQSLPPFGEYGFVVCVVSIFYLYSQLLLSVLFPLIFQCDGAGGCRSQGCHGFAPRSAHFTCGTTGLSGTNPQAHLLTISLMNTIVQMNLKLVPVFHRSRSTLWGSLTA